MISEGNLSCLHAVLMVCQSKLCDSTNSTFQSEGLVPEHFDYKIRPFCLYEFLRKKKQTVKENDYNIICRIILLSPSVKLENDIVTTLSGMIKRVRKQDSSHLSHYLFITGVQNIADYLF